MTQKVRKYCTCGAYWTGSFPRGAAGLMETAFDEIHRGPGHAPADPKTAARAREREERKAEHQENKIVPFAIFRRNA